MSHEPEAMTDEQLVQVVLAGDRERYAEIVERYQSRLVNYLFRLVRNSDDAHDLAQEVFVKVYQALDRFDPKYRFSTWLFRVAQNAAIDQIRRRRFRMVPIGSHEDEQGEHQRGVELVDEAPGADVAMEGGETRRRRATGDRGAALGVPGADPDAALRRARLRRDRRGESGCRSAR
jgi:RNA polymerase sigma factor (sigma-70 family)